MRIALNGQGQLESAVIAAANQRPPYTCANCQQAVQLRRRQRTWFFAHTPQAGGQHDAESAGHQAGKAALSQWLVNSQLTVTNEQVVANGQQRIDVCVPSQQLALEYQCSPITQADLHARHRGYAEAGWRDWWILGADNIPQSRWCAKTAQFCQYSPQLGFYVYVLRAPYQELELWHHLTKAPHQERWQGGDRVRYSLTHPWTEFNRWHSQAHRVANAASFSVVAWRQQLEWRVRRRDPRMRALLHNLYPKGLLVTDIPAWCFPTAPLPPVFTGSFFDFAVHTWLAERSGGALPTPPRLDAPLLSLTAQKKWIDYPIHWLARQRAGYKT